MKPNVMIFFSKKCGPKNPQFIIKSGFKQILFGFKQGPKKGLTDARSAVGFCLGSGLFGSYNSD